MGKRAHGGAWNLAITNKTIPPVVVPPFYELAACKRLACSRNNFFFARDKWTRVREI